jgi:hypothetical protein
VSAAVHEARGRVAFRQPQRGGESVLGISPVSFNKAILFSDRTMSHIFIYRRVHQAAMLATFPSTPRMPPAVPSTEPQASVLVNGIASRALAAMLCLCTHQSACTAARIALAGCQVGIQRNQEPLR